MFAYYLDLALRSLRRSKGLTALMVLTIAFGVAATMTSWSVFRAVSGDPIPWKSSRLYVPQVDNWGPSDRRRDDEPPDAMSYIDAVALMRGKRASHQSALYQIRPSVVPQDAKLPPFNVGGHAVFGEFFPMLDVPFVEGAGWSAADDEGRARVAVISSHLKTRLFGDAAALGKTVAVEGIDYRVVGVMAPWNPQPRFFDVVNSGGFNSTREDIFLPFNTAISVDLENQGNLNCNAVPKEGGFAGLRRSECVWIAFMVELGNAADAASYREYLDAYAREQQAIGRFNWAPNNRLRNLRGWLEKRGVVPSDTRVSLLVSLGLLIVCLVNTIGLLLAKFLRRSSEIGVRRALGAPRRAIYLQFLIEAGMVGVAGGVFGLVLTGLGVFGVAWVLPASIAELAKVDIGLLSLTLVVAVVATMLAGLYPTWRASSVEPAWQLKSN